MATKIWLNKEAKNFYDRHKKLIPLTDRTRETFLVLCSVYGEYRTAENWNQKKQALDILLKYCREFGLTLKSEKLSATNNNELQSLFQSQSND